MASRVLTRGRDTPELGPSPLQVVEAPQNGVQGSHEGQKHPKTGCKAAYERQGIPKTESNPLLRGRGSPKQDRDLLPSGGYPKTADRKSVV